MYIFQLKTMDFPSFVIFLSFSSFIHNIIFIIYFSTHRFIVHPMCRVRRRLFLPLLSNFIHLP